LGETWISESYICDNEEVKNNQMQLLLLIQDLLRHIILSLMLNTSIKVIATQYTDDRGWSQIWYKKVNSQHLLITYNQLTVTVVWSWSYGSWIYSYLWNPITTKVVSSNPVHGEVYSMQHYVIKLVSDLQQVGGFLRVFRFPQPIKLTATM
jgi:hypothetical protein